MVKTILVNRQWIVWIMLVFFQYGCSKTIDNSMILSFGTEISDDATPDVLAQILNSNQNISKIKFEKGIYHFYPDKGLEEYCHISNHCDVMVSTAFPIKNFKNLTIDGQGSTFIFHGIMVPFLVQASHNITVKNLSIDWYNPFHSEGLIVARDEKNRTFDMQISEAYPYEIRNHQLYFVKEYYEHNIGQSILYDPQRSAIAFNTEAYTNLTTIKKAETSRYLSNIKYKYDFDFRAPEYKKLGKEDRLFVEEIKKGLVRVHNHGKLLPQVGLILTMKGEQGFNRVAPAFRVTTTDGFNAQNVNVHHAGGMGIIAENSANLTLDNFNITPSKGRMVSTTADATHFVGCRGKVILRNCTFNNQLDDAANIHGTYQIVEDVLDEYRIGVRMGHHQQKGFVIGVPSDTIGLVRLSDSFDPYDQLTVKDIQYLNGRYQIITFHQKLPQGIQKGDLIENLSAYPEVWVQNCNIANNRARGLLISTPKKTIIEDNYFSTEMEAILIPVESSHWYESGSASNVLIQNNTFQDCQHSGYKRGVIRLDTDDDNTNLAFRNIEISNNIFNQFDNMIVQIANVDGFKFIGNTISNSGTFPQLFPDAPAFTVDVSKNVVFENNTYGGKAKQLIVTDESSGDIEFK
ncbi:alpha-1,3-galactosidase-related protein [Saccharicrinis fermentans]|uniref:Alpha-1,3-galactosidase B n=1 Tax=Saccharicrinis fermentans DSM 9555 = JCM 21142 TaxID=869213 RepID=W7YHX3_9BACT|nr:right-handed parallel beta-helix repeat-containing protein [Saccharicrinis fermentans]GAF02159.1 alpha-1,3-galactosidase B precursor [Saccharicrinis fermentans DSM 9555 = JCM 21142]